MPNWCEVILEIAGPEDSLDTIQKTKMSFERLLPVPSEVRWNSSPELPALKKQLARYGNYEGYDWCINNWGVKWSPSNVRMERRYGKLTVSFETPWGLPMRALLSLSEIFQYTEFYVSNCWEESGEFCGSITVKDGKITEDNIHVPTREECAEKWGDDYDEEDEQ